jgi:uncharacterized protein (TIGR02058 family)
MPLKRFLLQLGSGVDLHGRDYTKAAQRAVEDAIRRTSLNFMRRWGLKDRSRIHVSVTIGAPTPEKVDTKAVAGIFPFGSVDVKVVPGGLELPEGDPEDDAVIACAIVSVNLDMPDR